MIDRNTLILSYSSMLDYLPWDYFCTFTTRYHITLKSTRRLAEKLGKVCKLDTSGYMFWVAEPFDVREGYHFHALLNTPIGKHAIFEYWRNKYGRCDLQTYNEELKGSGYCAKYLQKYLSDYDIIKPKSIELCTTISKHQLH